MNRIDRRTVLAAALAAVPSVACARTQTGSGWTPRAALPWTVQEIYAAVDAAGRIVMAGGLAAEAGRLRIEDRTGIYDPVTDNWVEGPKLPAPRHHPMIVADANGRVHAFGGYGAGPTGAWTAMTEAWRLDGDAWTPVTAMPGPICESVGANLDGRIHLVTGRSPKGEANGDWDDQGDVATHLTFDPATGVWGEARPCPMARNSAAGAVLDGKLYVAGGRTVNGGGTGQLDRYDPATDRWETLSPIPSSAGGQQVGGGLAMGAAGGKLVAFGGEWFAPGGGGVFPETWIYDPARDDWSAGPPMRTPRHGLAGAVVNGRIYAVAGGEVVSGGRAGDVVEALSL